MYTAPLPPARTKISPIIIVPGITASGLTDWYPASPRDIWSPTRAVFSDYEPLMLHPSPPLPSSTPSDPISIPPLRYEAIQPSLVRESRAFGIIYDDLVAELRHDLSTDDVPVQPVYLFAYDWRQDNFITIRRLAAFIDEVIERTRLMPHDTAYVHGETCDAVDLVGHSMGGNLIAACIASGLVGFEDSCKVRRVVTLGTPFRGAPAALAKLATGLGSLTGRAAKARERAAARVTPSVYQLLPTYPGAIVRSTRHATAASANAGTRPDPFGIIDPVPAASPDSPSWEYVSLEEAVAYQPSILESLASAVRSRAVRVGKDDSPFAAARAAESILHDFLASAQRFAELTWKVTPDMLRRDDEGHPGDWLVLAGAGERTHIRCEILPTPAAETTLDFTRGYSDDSWNGESWDTGDDTVPMRSAVPPWRDGWRDTIVLRRGDFDWLGELGDRILRDQLGFHATLPRLNVAQRWIVNFLRPEWSAGSVPGFHQHGKVWARPSPSFWNSPFGESARDAIRHSPDDRDEILQTSLQEIWSAKIPGIRLSPVSGA